MSEADKTDEIIADASDTEEWKPTSRLFRRAAKKGNASPSLPGKDQEGNQRRGGKKKL